MDGYYIFKDIDITDKNILIAGLSKDKDLPVLKSKLEKKKDTFKVKVVDINGKLIADKKKEFEKFQNYFDFIPADICDISFIEDKTFDIIVLPFTISAINQRPMKALQAIYEVKRVLKDNGIVIFIENISTRGNTRDNYMFFNWYRKRKKLLFLLSGDKNGLSKTYFFLEDLKYVLRKSGFELDNIDHEAGEIISSQMKRKLYEELTEIEIGDTGLTDNTKSVIGAEFSKMKDYESHLPPYVIIRCSKKS